MLSPPACLNGVYPAETQPVLADRPDGLHAPGYSGNLLKEAVKRLNTLTFFNFFVAMILLRPQVFFLVVFLVLVCLLDKKGLRAYSAPCKPSPGDISARYPWSPRCQQASFPKGAALTPDMPPHARIFALVQVFFRICLFFQHVRQHPATDFLHLHAAGL